MSDNKEMGLPKCPSEEVGVIKKKCGLGEYCDEVIGSLTKSRWGKIVDKGVENTIQKNLENRKEKSKIVPTQYFFKYKYHFI